VKKKTLAMKQKLKCWQRLQKNKEEALQAKAQGLLQDPRLAQGKLVAQLQRCIDANLVQLNKHHLAKWE
jgi:hypothetical protein